MLEDKRREEEEEYDENKDLDELVIPTFEHLLHTSGHSTRMQHAERIPRRQPPNIMQKWSLKGRDALLAREVLAATSKPREKSNGRRLYDNMVTW
ncbi:hypothetical protein IFM47457_08187 [Aspergillus lentulus]|nr:hypothetical protein IFM47457_08187 [Aspergillus lentulus]